MKVLTTRMASSMMLATMVLIVRIAEDSDNSIDGEDDYNVEMVRMPMGILVRLVGVVRMVRMVRMVGRG